MSAHDDKYDVIIVGAGIAGLGVAGLLQKAGVKALVLEKGMVPGGRATTRQIDGGWKVDSGIHCVDLGDQSPCAVLLEKLGRKIDWSTSLQGVKVFDGNKWLRLQDYIALSPDEKRQLTELITRFINMTSDEIEAMDNMSMAQFIRENVPSPKVAEFLNVTGMIQTTLPESEMISMGEFVYTFTESIKSTRPGNRWVTICMPVGGIGVMTTAMAEAVVAAGGTIEYGTRVDKVVVSNDKQIKVFTDRACFEAAAVVLALPIWQMVHLLKGDEDKLPQTWWRRMNSLVDETSAALGYTIATGKPLLNDPVYLAAWRLPGLNLPLQVLIHTNFDQSIAPPGHMIAFAGLPCTPAQARDKEFVDRMWPLFWQSLKDMFPGLEQSLIWKTDEVRIGIDGLSRRPGFTGKYRPEVFLPGVKGLYFSGDCYTGRGVGMNGAANSAMICAEKIIADRCQDT